MKIRKGTFTGSLTITSNNNKIKQKTTSQCKNTHYLYIGQQYNKIINPPSALSQCQKIHQDQPQTA